MTMRRHLVLLAILGAASAVAAALLISGLSNATAERADLEARTQGGSDPGVAIILSDARDGRIDGKWSCPSMRYVADRVPVLVYSKPLASLRDATGRTCNAALKQLQPGASPSRVANLLGHPDKAPRCWLYRWPIVAGASGDGARICFAHQRVSQIQRSQHL